MAPLSRRRTRPGGGGGFGAVDELAGGPHGGLRAAADTLGGVRAQTVGAADVPCREHRGHQVDVVALHGDRVIALGEAKWRSVTTADVDRLRHIRDVTPGAGGAQLLLFTAGTPKIPAGRSRDVEIIDLERLYTGD